MTKKIFASMTLITVLLTGCGNVATNDTKVIGTTTTAMTEEIPTIDETVVDESDTIYEDSDIESSEIESFDLESSKIDSSKTDSKATTTKASDSSSKATTTRRSTDTESTTTTKANTSNPSNENTNQPSGTTPSTSRPSNTQPSTTQPPQTTRPETTTTPQPTTTQPQTTQPEPTPDIPRGYTGRSGIYWRTREETIESWGPNWQSMSLSNMTGMQKIVRANKSFESMVDNNLANWGDSHDAEYYRNIGRNLSHNGTDYDKARAVYEYQRDNMPGYVNCIYHASVTYALCEGVGLEVAYASRMDSGDTGRLSDFYNSHVANAVYVDGAWYILDGNMAVDGDEFMLGGGSRYQKYIDKYENVLNLNISADRY